MNRKKNPTLADCMLRRAGFKIHSRKRGKPAIWERQDDLYTEHQADEIEMKEAVARAGIEEGKREAKT